MLKKEELIGTWVIDSKDTFGDVSMTFKDNGSLIYLVKDGDKDNAMFLTYRVEGEYTITDQPSSPREEKTKAKIGNNKLLLDYEGVISSYSKVN